MAIPEGFPDATHGFPLCLGIEVVLRCGLAQRMFEYAKSREDGERFLSPARTESNTWIGQRDSRVRKPEDVNLNQLPGYFGPELTSSMRDFIQACPPSLHNWLSVGAYGELDKLRRLRNRAAHTDPVSYEEVSEMRDDLYKGGLLQRLLEAGGLTQQSDTR